MRDLILFMALLAVVPLIVRAPIVGLMTWLWVSLMHPQREVFGFLAGFEINFYIALITGVSWLVSKERKTIPLNPTTLFLCLFALWTVLTTYMALYTSYSEPLMIRTLKTVVLALIVVTIVNTKSRMQALLWIIVISIGYYGVKGGGYVLLTGGGGGNRIYGPENSMIGDNNSLGLALVILLPILNYLRITSRRRDVRLALLAAIGLCFVAILGTYSRGALLALGAAIAVYAMRSRAGVAFLVVAVVLGVSLPKVMPQDWLARMSTIQEYDKDASFEGRIAAWKTSFNIASDRPLIGGGFSSVEIPEVVHAYKTPGSLERGRAAHSVYFQVLGDHGFAGLALYLLMLGSTIFNTIMVVNLTRGRPDMLWANQLARMLQISIAAFMVGGAALSMAYYDGFIVIFVLTGALWQIVRQPQVQATAGKPEPNWKKIAADEPRSLPAPAQASTSSSG